MRPAFPVILRAVLFSFLLLSSCAIVYTTILNTRTAQSLADSSLESTALSLSTSAESVLRIGGKRMNEEIREILSDRVMAYALIAGSEGAVLFHTNPRLVGTRIEEEGLKEWLRAGRTFGRRVTLGTGLSAYEFNYVLHRPDGGAEILRLVLHTAAADRVVAGARHLWWTVGVALLMLWTVGILLERVFARHLRLQAEADRRDHLALIGQMTATLAHEIRNALGSVKGYAQWADEKIGQSDPTKLGLAVILRGTGRIESLVNDLLLFSREETYSIESFELAPLVRDTVEAETSSWTGKVEQETADGIRAMADPEKLRRVLSNGIRNAIQAMGTGGTLRVSARAEGARAVIRIEDDGPGISPGELPRLFTPFHTTRADGTGLGLAYSKKVIEGMRGVIELSNRPEGRGAALVVRIPKGGSGKWQKPSWSSTMTR